MSAAPRVLVVANRTATTAALLEAVAERARQGPAVFYLVVPATARGLHRVVDPEDAGKETAEETLRQALPLLSRVAGCAVKGSVGDANPLSAVADAVNLTRFDEIIISTLRPSVSRWMRVDLLSKVRALGLPVTHVQPEGIDACVIDAAEPATARR